eukprot:Sspe_Gene.76946::Locus_48052_Transcript_1_1_Confidence_1.000_Length_836::g.76946::m.76946/K12614/DDX6, RCK, DHH1; ATP-dependent RNA helicase DDX6/DHH1
MSSYKDGLNRPAPDRRKQTEDVTNTNGSEFEDFHLKESLMKGLYTKNFDRPSPIQELCIPLTLAGQSILARAKNGTGKTGAFLIPALEKIDTSRDCLQVVVLTPTRELALQTSMVAKELSSFIPNMQIMVTTGGTSLQDDILRLYQPVHLLVATPGRLGDLAGKNVAKLGDCKLIILDEADKLLSPEFVPLIEKLLTYLPTDRQILLFSATFPLSVEAFCRKHMENADKINLMEELTLKGISQFYAYVDGKQKIHCLNT